MKATTAEEQAALDVWAWTWARCRNLYRSFEDRVVSISDAPDDPAAVAGIAGRFKEATSAEIGRLKQALWDCAGEAGADLDGMPTPAARASPSVEEFALRAVRELRRDYNECLTECEHDAGLTARLVRLERAAREAVDALRARRMFDAAAALESALAAPDAEKGDKE